MHKISFYNKFIIRLYMFRALCTHYQVNIVLYSIWYRHTCRWPSRESSLNPRTGRPPTECDDTRCRIIQWLNIDKPAILT